MPALHVGQHHIPLACSRKPVRLLPVGPDQLYEWIAGLEADLDAEWSRRGDEPAVLLERIEQPAA